MSAERLEGLLATAQRPVLVSAPAAVGATVEAQDVATGRLLTYRLVEPHEASPADGLLSVDSPVGAALLGACAGEEATAGTARGDRGARGEHVGVDPAPPGAPATAAPHRV